MPLLITYFNPIIIELTLKLDWMGVWAVRLRHYILTANCSKLFFDVFTHINPEVETESQFVTLWSISTIGLFPAYHTTIALEKRQNVIVHFVPKMVCVIWARLRRVGRVVYPTIFTAVSGSYQVNIQIINKCWKRIPSMPRPQVRVNTKDCVWCFTYFFDLKQRIFLICSLVFRRISLSPSRNAGHACCPKAKWSLRG